MTPFEGKVRVRVYELLVAGRTEIDVETVATSGGWDIEEVATALDSLAAQHRIATTESRGVWMAHPFSGVPTQYRAEIGGRSWFANCAWDALAILALLGDGEAHGPDGLVWSVARGDVTPDGLVHLLVPAREFWDDIGFT